VHCSALQKRWGRLADHYGALQCVAMHCGTSQNVAKHLRNVATIAMRCGALRKRCEGFRIVAVHCSALEETLQKVCRPLWSFTVQVAHPAVECITYSAPVIAYGNVTESLYGPQERLRQLQCTTVLCRNVAEALRAIGMLPNHCGSRRIAVQVAHVAAECTTHSRKHQNSIYLPYHPANPQKPKHE